LSCFPSSLRRFFVISTKVLMSWGSVPRGSDIATTTTRSGQRTTNTTSRSDMMARSKPCRRLKAVGLVEALNAQRAAVTTAPTT